jgi:hypothetical protein
VFIEPLPGYVLTCQIMVHEVEVEVTLRLTVSQSVSLGVEPHLGLMTRYILLFDNYGLAFVCALSDERTGLSFVYAAGPCQCSLSRVQVPWDWRPYFTVSDLILPFLSPPTTRRVTVEVFDPASTREVWFIIKQIINIEPTQQLCLIHSDVNMGVHILHKRLTIN